MDLRSFKTLKKILQSPKENIEAMDPIGYDIDMRTRRHTPLEVNEFREDVAHYIRLHSEANFRGYMYPPTTCDNHKCPMYNGQRWTFVFYMDGESYKHSWSFKSDDNAIDTECGDHSWLPGI